MSLYIFIVLVSVTLLCQGYPKYRDLIPYGHFVPNPCTPLSTDVWKRVGHALQTWTRGEISVKTRFGKDFSDAKKNSKKDETGDDGIWPILCPKDSDGDGRTNGEELGDKHCAWRKSINGTSVKPAPGVTLYHPGIFENKDGTLNKTTQDIHCK